MTKSFLASSIATGALLLCWASANRGATAQPKGRRLSDADIARHGCNHCRFLSERQLLLTNTGKRVYRAKVTENGRIRVLNFDNAANPISDAEFTRLREAEIAARLSTAGSFSPEILDKAAQAPTDERIPIRVVVVPSNLTSPPISKRPEDKTEQRQWSEHAKESLQHAVQSLATELGHQGATAIRIEGRDLYATVPHEVLHTLKHRDDVFLVAPDNKVRFRESGDHLNVIRNRVATQASFNGSGQTIGFMEVAPPSSTHLSHLVGLPAGGRRCEPNCSGGGFHALDVMGIVRRADTNWTLTTAASTVVSDTGWLGSLSDDADWLINTWDTRVINGSLEYVEPCPLSTSSSAYAAALDLDLRAKMYPYPTFVLGAGNSGSCVSNVIQNGLVVGGSLHSTSDRWPSAIWSGSNWQNPSVASPHLDRELPHLVAPCDPTVIASAGCGTSYAAPQVSGVLARLRSMPEGQAWEYWPEVFRATILATADTNVDGTEYYSTSYENEADFKDGTGLLNAQRAIQVMAASDVDPVDNPNLTGGARGTTLTNDEFGSYVEIPLSLSGTFRIRVAASFNATPNVAQKSYTLDADVDVRLLRSDSSDVVCQYPAGGERNVSTSWDNTNEFFTCTIANPSPDGMYKILVSGSSFSEASYAWVGVGWAVTFIGS